MFFSLFANDDLSFIFTRFNTGLAITSRFEVGRVVETKFFNCNLTFILDVLDSLKRLSSKRVYYSTAFSRVQIHTQNEYKYPTVFVLQKTGLTGLLQM